MVFRVSTTIRENIIAFLAVIIIGLSLSGYVSYLFYEAEEDNYIAEQQMELETDLTRFLNDLRFWGFTLTEIEGFYNASNFVDRDEFNQFVSTISQNRKSRAAYGWISIDDLEAVSPAHIETLSPTYLYSDRGFDVSDYMSNFIFQKIKEHKNTTNHRHDVQFISNLKMVDDAPILILFREVHRKDRGGQIAHDHHDHHHGLLGFLLAVIDLSNMEAYQDALGPDTQIEFFEYFDTREQGNVFHTSPADLVFDDQHAYFTDVINFGDHHIEVTLRQNTDFQGFSENYISIFVFIGGVILTLFCLIFIYLMADKYSFQQTSYEASDNDAEIFEKEAMFFNSRAKGLWKRALFCFALLGIFSSGMYGLSEYMRQTSVEAATSINVSGRQRMLSQRIALFSNKYINDIQAAENAENANRAKVILKDARDLFERSHIGLVSGDANMRLSGHVGKAADHIYYQEPLRLDQQVKDYISFVDIILKSDDLQAQNKALQDINRMSRDRLLFGLNEVVQFLEDRENSSMASLLLVERVSFLITVLLLIFSIIFVMWPYHKFVIFALNERRLMQKLKQALNEAEQANLAKSDFLANMSHELRTPLNSIIGITQIMDMKKLNKDERESMDIISTSSKFLLELVNDILDLSKIEANEIELEFIPFDVVQRVRHTVNAMKPLASQKGLTLICSERVSSLYVVGDALRFSSILTNLIGNAVCYTEEGLVDVRVIIDHVSENQATVRCEIKDTGIGIAEDKIDYIFEKFTQADSTITRKFGGTGLGLTITKQLVELMNGDMGAESQLGEGSLFWFEIPFETLDELPEDIKAAELIESEFVDVNRIPVQDVRILMAEDHAMNQKFMAKLFTALGIEHHTLAVNGKEALEKVESGNYDIVLMDCHMPEMNGYDATKGIRSLPDPVKSAIPIVAMTANAMPEDESKCLEIGMDAYIPKPVDLDLFKEKLSPWVNFDPDEPSEIEVEEDSVDELSDPSDAIKPVDLDNLRENSMDDEDFIKEMVALFVTQGDEQLRKLEQQCTDGDNHDWVEISHALKGTAAGVGAMPMRDICDDAQNMADVSADARTEMLGELRVHYDAAKQFFINEGLYKD